MRETDFVFLFCVTSFFPGIHLQVPGFGDQKSIGVSPFPPSSFFPDEVWGVNNGRDNRWPNGIIPYTFSYTKSDDGILMTPELAAQQVDMLQGIMNSTCVKFVPRTNEKDYITFRFENGCDSHMGPQGGQQFINLRPFCFPTIHEVIHALGFNHEQIRRDRDYYIAFNWTNTYPESLEKTNLPTYGTSLDPKSIMMSCCGSAIDIKYPFYILPNGSDPLINNAFRFYSEGDRQKINRAYNCIPEDSCWDEDPYNCPVWAAADGACNDPDWVPNIACPKKCCSDSYPDFCKANAAYCTNPSWGKEYCPKTCNYCPPGSEKDNRDDCQYITATLGCNKDPVNYPGGMAKYCRKSCGFCTRPAVVDIPPMILTKCNRTCNYWCQTNTGCNHSASPKPNGFSDSYCRGDYTDEQLVDWCKTSTSSSVAYCETTCYNVGVYKTCPPQCVDSDPVNCPNLATTHGCFSLYPL